MSLRFWCAGLFVRRLMTQANKRMDLIGLLCLIQDRVSKTLPFQWTLFATDVAELYAARGHFVERTDEASHKRLCRSFKTLSVYER